MFWKRRASHAPGPVTGLVRAIQEDAHASRAAGPSSTLSARNAQLSSTLTRAGMLLVTMDNTRSRGMRSLFARAEPPAEGRASRKSWFSSGPSSPGPGRREIERLLRAATKDATPLVLDISSGETPLRDLDCRLPKGAIDPVCEPR